MKKLFAKKSVKIILSIIILVLFIVAVSNSVFAFVANKQQTGNAVCDDWSAEDSFDMSNVNYLDMGEDDFKILCFTDIHIRNHGTFASAFGVNFILDAASKVQLNKMIKNIQPDLIVITGDTTLTAWNDISLQKFSDFMDSFKIPWAHVYGNHDMEGRADKEKLSDILINSEYGLFECGPETNGMGNYIINLKRDDEIAYSLFMFDNGENRIINESITYGGINNKQMQWYKWATDAIEFQAGKKVPNMAFMHIPIPEYNDISEQNYIFGTKAEDVCCAVENDGFFKVFKENSGTHLFAGHDHVNNFISEYEEVTFCYINKSSYNCYFSKNSLGGTLVTIDKNNEVDLEVVDFN